MKLHHWLLLSLSLLLVLCSLPTSLLAFTQILDVNQNVVVYPHTTATLIPAVSLSTSHNLCQCQYCTLVIIGTTPASIPRISSTSGCITTRFRSRRSCLFSVPSESTSASSVNLEEIESSLESILSEVYSTSINLALQPNPGLFIDQTRPILFCSENNMDGAPTPNVSGSFSMPKTPPAIWYGLKTLVTVLYPPISKTRPPISDGRTRDLSRSR